MRKFEFCPLRGPKKALDGTASLLKGFHKYILSKSKKSRWEVCFSSEPEAKATRRTVLSLSVSEHTAIIVKQHDTINNKLRRRAEPRVRAFASRPLQSSRVASRRASVWCYGVMALWRCSSSDRHQHHTTNHKFCGRYGPKIK